MADLWGWTSACGCLIDTSVGVAVVALRRTVLTYDSTREPFGNPEAFLEAAHRPPASRPFGVAVTADGRYAYLANTGAGTVEVIATATGDVSAPITVGSGPTGVAICAAKSTRGRP